MNPSQPMKKLPPRLDPALPGLDVALDPSRLERELAPILLGEGVTPLPGTLRILGVQPLKHRIGRRCSLAISLQLGDRRLRLFAKAFRTGRGRRAVRGAESIATALDGTGTARVPSLLHFFDEYDLAIFEFVDGESVAGRVYSKRPGRGARLVGKSLRDLHRCGAELPRRWTVGSELETTARWCEKLDSSVQDQAADLLERLQRVAGTLEPCNPVPIHRDCYPEQLLAVDRVCYVLDLDDVRLGDPTVDLGNFLAHLRLRSLQKTGEPGEFAASASEILRAYGAGACASTDMAGSSNWHRRLCFHETTSLVRLAGVYAIRPAWAESLPTLLLIEAERRLAALG